MAALYVPSLTSLVYVYLFGRARPLRSYKLVKLGKNLSGLLECFGYKYLDTSWLGLGRDNSQLQIGPSLL